MNTVHKFPFSIAYADTDAGGVVYHARYLEIAERARMKWLMNNIVLPDDDLGFIIKDLDIKYIKPLRLADDIFIETRLIKMGAASLNIEQTFVKDADVYAVLNATAVYIGSNMKPKRIPEDIIKILK